MWFSSFYTHCQKWHPNLDEYREQRPFCSTNKFNRRIQRWVFEEYQGNVINLI